MSEEEIWDWPRIRSYLLDSDPPPVAHDRSIIESEALRDAMYGPDETLDETVARIMSICMLLGAIHRAGNDGDPHATAAAIRRMDSDRGDALSHLRAAAAMLSEPHRAKILQIASEVEADKFPQQHIELLAVFMDPELLRERGRAASDRKSAWTGWCIRSLDKYVKPTARNRYTCIARLLKLANVHTSAQNVRGVLLAGRT